MKIGAFERLFFTGFFFRCRSLGAGNSFHGLFGLDVEEDGGESDRQEVGDRLGQIDGVFGVVFPQQRQEIDQGDQENEFPHDRRGQRAFGIADRREGLLAGDLDPE